MSLVRHYEEVSKLLEAAKPKWISVEERLPDEFGQVLGVLDGMVTMLFYSGDGKFRTGNGLVFEAESEYLTHWMPLPEPPKE